VDNQIRLMADRATLLAAPRTAGYGTRSGGEGRPAPVGGNTMSRYEVDSAQVAQAGVAVQASAQQISTQVDSMMRHLLDLQNSWRGQAASSFQHVITDWRATQERVKLSLDEIQHALTLASQQYAQAEDSAARMFAQ
jgi:6 kDa early secretory antigenic target